MPTSLTPEQKKVAGAINKIARQVGASPKEVKAAYETGLVESNLTNIKGGDRDSSGWRQERASLYPDPNNLDASIRRFFTETSAAKGKYGKAGDLAAAVQRPAAQYRGRYQERSGEADQLMAMFGGRSTPAGGSVPSSTVTTERTVQDFDDEGFERARRRSVVGQMLAKNNPDSLLLKAGAVSAEAPDPSKFTTSRTETSTETVETPDASTSSQETGGAGAGKAVAEAAKRLGVGEKGTSNRGERLDQWQQKYGMLGQPWCGIFVGLNLEKAGVQGVTSRVASVAAIEEDAKAGSNGFKSWHAARDARPGDALVTRQAGHVGLVEKVEGDTIWTIEGNTSTGKVERRQHKVSDVYGAARPRYGR